MTRRSETQLVLLFIGLVVWGYGQRVDNELLRYIGIAFFAAATILRFFKRGTGQRLSRSADGEGGERDRRDGAQD